MLHKIAPNVVLMGGNGSTMATIETVPSQDLYGTSLGFGGTTFNDGLTHIRWGQYDNLPLQKMKLLQNSPNKMQLVITARDFVIGGGLGVFKKKPDLETGEIALKPFYSPAIESWLRRNRIYKYLNESAFQQGFSGNVFTNISYNPRLKEANLNVVDQFICRLAKPKTEGTPITAFKINPRFGLQIYNTNDTATSAVPGYDPSDPLRFLESIWHGKDCIPGQPHYGFKPWWFTESWTQITDLIAQFHINGLKNGYNIKYHIRIPEEYYDKLGDTIEERELAKDTLQKNMDKWLAGVENVNKAMVTHYLAEKYGEGKTAGIEIIEMKNNLPDDAYTKLFDTANIAQAGGHGILPALAGINVGSTLGNSGDQLRVAARFQEDYRTENDRHILTEPIRFAADMMGWDDDIVFWPKRIQDTPTLDKIAPDQRAGIKL